MNRAPKVSVVLIFLNEERFLAEAIDSIRSQTSSDWELLLVDDGSSDRSGEIARECAARAPGRVQCFTHPNGGNRGMSESRNLAIPHPRAAAGR